MGVDGRNVVEVVYLYANVEIKRHVVAKPKEP